MPMRAAMSESGVMTAVRTSLSLIVRTLPSTWLKRGSMKTSTKPGREATTVRSSCGVAGQDELGLEEEDAATGPRRPPRAAAAGPCGGRPRG